MVFKKLDPTQELIFPPSLVSYAKSGLKPLRFDNGRCQWFRPTSVDELIKLKEEFPHAKLISGNTEVGVEFKLKRQRYPVLVYVGDIPELRSVTVNEEGIVFGANITLTEFGKHLSDSVKTHERFKTEGFKALLVNLKWFAGHQIRNVASLAGNICTASPISDLNPVLVAAKAKICVTSTEGERDIALDSFFLGYRKTALNPAEVVLKVVIPFTTENEFVRAYKQAKRKDDDIAIANAGIRAVLDEDGKIVDCSMAFGGMGPTTVQGAQAASQMVGCAINDREAISKVCETLMQSVIINFRCLL